MFMVTKYKNLQLAVEEAFKKGDNYQCDMTVEDIYGDGIFDLGLPKEILASTMGKVSKEGPVD